MINTQVNSIALYVALRLSNTDMSQFNEPDIYLENTKDFYNFLNLFYNKKNSKCCFFVI